VYGAIKFGMIFYRLRRTVGKDSEGYGFQFGFQTRSEG